MKKLIALIGAAAMAFGLYAEDPNYIANSFEKPAEGVSADGLTWDATIAPWSTTLDDVFNVDEYATGEPANVYAEGAVRRDECFVGSDENKKFLKLETGTNVLDCTFSGLTYSVDKFYFDQLVKFTGFEEIPTFADDTKIAVWMSAIEQEGEDPEADDYIAGSTNLYVQVGTGAGSTNVAVTVEGISSWAVDTWYRVTIKSIGNVMADGSGSQLGFLVFINGKPAKIVAAEQDYFTKKGQLDASVKSAYYEGDEGGRLFVSMTQDTSLAKVGYQGIGGIDDVVLSEEAPDFDSTVDVEFVPIDSATVVSVVDEKGNVFDYTGAAIAVAPGTLTVTLKAKPGFIFANDTFTKEITIKDAGQYEIELAEGTDYELAVAMIVNAADLTKTNYLAAAQLATLTGLANGDTATILQSCSITNSVGDTLYSFTPETVIKIAEGGNWDVFVASYIDGGSETAWMADYVGLAAEKQVVVGFEAPEVSFLSLGGEIAGDGEITTVLNVTNGSVFIDAPVTVGDETGAGAILKAAYISTMGATGTNNKIKLGMNGRVITKADSSLTEADFELPSGETLEIGDADADGYITYKIAGSFKVTVNDAENVVIKSIVVDDGEPTTAAGEFDVTTKITVTYEPAQGYKFVDDGETGIVEREAAGTINAPAVEIIKTGFAIIIADGAATNYYPTLDAAIAAAGTGEPALPTTVTLLANCELTQCCVISKTVTLDIGEFDVTASTAEGVLEDDSYVGKQFVNGTPRMTLFVVEHGANLTVLGTTGTIDASRALVGAAITMTKSGDDATKGDAVLTVNANLSGYYYAIAGNGKRPGSAITINGGTIQGTKKNDSAGIYAPQAGAIVINGGTITGATGIYAKSGELTVNGGTIAAVGAAGTPTYNGNGFESTGDAIILDGAGKSYKGEMTLVLGKGATLTSANSYGVREVVTKGDTQTLAITDNGASITGMLGGVNVSDEFVAQVEAGIATITGYVADVNGLCYKTLAEAFTAVTDDGTVTLLDNLTLDAALTFTMENTVGVTLDLNGKTLTSGVDNALVIAGADTKLTIANGEYVSNFDNALRAENGATVTIAADAEITGIACVQTASATLNVYGDIVITGADDAIDAYGSVINIYDGALVKTTGEECSGVCMVDYGYGVGTVNLNGGEIEAMYAIYDYLGDDTAANINLIGGTIKGYLNNCVSLNGKLTDECKTLFTVRKLEGLFSIDAFCATGYEPTDVTGGCQIAKATYNVTVDDVQFATYQISDAAQTVELTEPAAKEHKKFTGWTTEATGVTFNDNVATIAAGTTGNIAITSEWADLYAINFEVTGGTADQETSPVELAKDDTITFTATGDNKLKSVTIDGVEDDTIDTTATTYIFTVGEKAATVAVVFEAEQSGWDDKEAGDGESAASKYGIPTASKLANVDAGKLGAWATANGVDFADFMAAPDTFEEAYLLNCKVEEVATKKAEFKFTAIVPGQTPTIGDAGKYGNGKVEVYGATKLGADADWAIGKEGATFYKAKLVPVAYNENK